MEPKNDSLTRREASSYLNSWRGFPLVSDMEVDRDVRCEMLPKHSLVLFSEPGCPRSRVVGFFMNIVNSRLLFNETNPLVEELSSESMGQNEIEKLPRAWQYILPQKFYDGWVINLQNLFRYD